jgi:phosphate transport system ATP-binding protein
MNAAPVLTTRELGVFHDGIQILFDISLDFPPRGVTALIGPSGSGKSTLLSCLNRMSDLVPGITVEGSVLFHGENIYGANVDAAGIRRRIGTVFQRPNPFPRSVYENIAWGARINGYSGNMDDLVEESLTRCSLWDEVKDKLRHNALKLSAGQQQRLCIARSLAVEPEVLLMDEPTSALDPISTAKIEDLIAQLKEEYTVVFVTHNMQQAGRVSEHTAFLLDGQVIEAGNTRDIFFNPQEARTEAYISGRL